MDDARQLAERSDIYEEESLAALNETIDAMEGLELTADNIYPAVQTLRESMAALDKKPAAIAPPVLYYDFEDGSLADRRGGYDGEAMNDPGFESGFMGEGLTLGEGYVRIDDAMQVGMEDFSVSFWMRSDEEKNDTVFFDNKSGDSGNDLGVFFCNYDGFFANAGDGSSRYDTSSYDRDQTAMNGKWHLITVSADRDGALSLYVDGRLSAENRQFADLKRRFIDVPARPSSSAQAPQAVTARMRSSTNSRCMMRRWTVIRQRHCMISTWIRWTSPRRCLSMPSATLSSSWPLRALICWRRSFRR